jgi:hypothetical protein
LAFVGSRQYSRRFFDRHQRRNIPVDRLAELLEQHGFGVRRHCFFVFHFELVRCLRS